MWSARKLLQRLALKAGYSITHAPDPVGLDAWADIASFLRAQRPLIFDVGANVGQSIPLLRKARNRRFIRSSRAHRHSNP